MRHDMKRRGLLHILLLGLVWMFVTDFTAASSLRPYIQPLPGSDFVPEWSKSAVWYQIFPERFRNGDPSNDPAPEDLVGSWPHHIPEGWKISNWLGDWYELQPWERTNERGFYFNVQHRRYGGDLQGVLEKLDYLKDLGITAIYFNPLFESPSLHKYDAALYHHIDNNFGPDPAGDKKLWSEEDPSDPATWQWTAADRLFLRLIEEAHRRGIRIVIDGVFNHVGLRFWAFEDVMKHQQRSRYKDWFSIKRWDDPNTPENEFDYEGWAGVRELPEIREDDNGLVESFAQHVHAIVRRWMDPNGDGDPSDGIDGWRLDVAEKVNIRFWQRFRQWVRDINPEAYLVGEVWWEDWPNDKMFNAAPWLQGDVFDAVMNYRWTREAFLFFSADRTRISASEFSQRLLALLGDYPSQVNSVLMNLYDSHDTDRIGSRLLNADLLYDHQASPGDNPSYNIRKPGKAERRTQELMVLFQMTYVGAPMIYYGAEAGMWGADDPDCRKPMVWEGMQFSKETSHPFGESRPPDTPSFDRELHQFYRMMIGIRKANAEFMLGDLSILVSDNSNDIIAYQRTFKNQSSIVVLNNSGQSRTVSIPLGTIDGHDRWVSVFGGSGIRLQNGALLVNLDGRAGAILKRSQL